MKPRYTLALFLLFLALVGLAIYAGRDREPREMTAGTATPTPEPILTVEPESVQEVDVVGADGSYNLRRVAGGWEVDGQEASSTVDGVVSRLASPMVVRKLAADRDPEEYGFATPSLTVTLRTQDGSEHVLVFGDDTPVGGNAYVRLGTDGPIYIVSSSDLSLLKEWLLSPPLAPTPTPEGGEATEESGDEATPEDGGAEATGEATGDATGEATGESTGTATEQPTADATNVTEEPEPTAGATPSASPLPGGDS